MASKATTDEIAAVAINTCKKEWEAFLALPIIVNLLIGLSVMALDVWMPTIGGSIISGVISLAGVIFTLSYFSARMKWAEELHKKKKKININKGLRFGLTRSLWLIWTGIVASIKIILWSIAFGFPGIYASLMYSKSFQATALEGMAGHRATRISHTTISKAGIIRTLSNACGVKLSQLFINLILIALTIAISLPSVFLDFETVLFITVPVALIALSITQSVVATYFSFEYLYFRDEASSEVKKLKKMLS